MEKSVMKMDSIYGKNNVSVATSGKTITPEQIKLLLKYGVKQVILAFDRDYESFNEINQKRMEYKNIVSFVKNFCNVSMLIDYEGRLDLKDAPIDKGREIFEYLMNNKIIL